jgi:uncharacterized membrane protein
MDRNGVELRGAAMARTTAPATARSEKRPSSRLAGAYGHPIHPILVTIPIGAWVLSLLFDIISRAVDDRADVYASGAELLIGVGIIGALLAAIWGVLDYRTIPRGTPAFRTATLHLLLNDVTIVLFAVSWFIRRGDDEATGIGLIGLSVVALALLGASGWLGGKLAYRFGVRVVDEATQAEGYDGRPAPHLK